MTNAISDQMKTAAELNVGEFKPASQSIPLKIDGMDLSTIRENQEVYQSLQDAGLSDAEIQEKGAKELFDIWLQYEGIIGYTTDIRNALWTLITASPRYLATTDQEKEEWLKSMLGFGTDPA